MSETDDRAKFIETLKGQTAAARAAKAEQEAKKAGQNAARRHEFAKFDANKHTAVERLSRAIRGYFEEAQKAGIAPSAVCRSDATSLLLTIGARTIYLHDATHPMSDDVPTIEIGVVDKTDGGDHGAARNRAAKFFLQDTDENSSVWSEAGREAKLTDQAVAERFIKAIATWAVA